MEQKFLPMSQLPPLEGLPDALNGASTPEQWRARREEIKEILCHYMLGHLPEKEFPVSGEVLSAREVYGGKGVREEIRLDIGRRNSDNCSLGDWVENPEKLPHGIAGLAERINALGLKFGLWFEPEMISPDSDLYRAHPDWCLHAEGRERVQSRQQLILDMSREEVQDYVIEAVSKVLRGANIEYVKWDMNRNMTESFSQGRDPRRQLETQHRYMLGLYRVMEKITSDFPEVLFESCSGGGGRFDAGMLYYMPQTWTSDDTDAVERLCLQYGTSYVYPASAMGAHVSAVPNHQTGRVTGMRMRGEVAMGGNFGFELDLSKSQGSWCAK